MREYHTQRLPKLREPTIQCCVVVALFLVSLCLNRGYAADKDNGCIAVPINSAGTFYFKKGDLRSVAIGSGGPSDVYDYVKMLVPMGTGGYDFSDVAQIILAADIKHQTQVSCQVFPNYPDLSQCAVSMAGTGLILIVKFDKTFSKAPPRYEERTMAVAKFMDSEMHACKTKELIHR